MRDVDAVTGGVDVLLAVPVGSRDAVIVACCVWETLGDGLGSLLLVQLCVLVGGGSNDGEYVCVRVGGTLAVKVKVLLPVGGGVRDTLVELEYDSGSETVDDPPDSVSLCDVEWDSDAVSVRSFDSDCVGDASERLGVGMVGDLLVVIGRLVDAVSCRVSDRDSDSDRDVDGD